MNLELESFLDEAFKSIQPLWKEVGRVVVEPDYEAEHGPQDGPKVAQELAELLNEQSPEPAAVGSHDGQEIQISDRYPLIAKFIRSITLHHEHLEGSWIEVAPPGNWI